MIRHLTPARFKEMPWANGKGVTVEMLRIDGPNGLMLRLSRATVAENGPFSIFPAVERNLTVVSGPGFDLIGAVAARCAPLCPVAFPGDVAVAAANVTAPSDDLNVMTARALPRPEVRAFYGPDGPIRADFAAFYAVAAATLGDVALRPGDLVLSDDPVTLTAGGPVLAVTLNGAAARDMARRV